MVSERMAAIRDDFGSSVVVAMFIGVASGLVVAVISVASNAEPSDGFLGTLAGNTVGMTIVLVVAATCGVGLGLIIGMCEGAVVYLFAQSAAKRFASLPRFAFVLALVLVLANTTVTALVEQLAFGSQGRSINSVGTIVSSAVATLLAILAFAKLQSSDWPHPRAHSVLPVSSYVERLDLNAAEATLRHDRLSDQVRDRIAAEEKMYDDDDGYHEPTIGHKKFNQS